VQESWPDHVQVADLGYGAIYVAQDLGDADPPYSRLVLLAGIARGRKLGVLYRRRWQGPLPDTDEIQARIREAGAGVIDLDHLLIIAGYFGVLPPEVITLELEPVHVDGGEELSPSAAALLPIAMEQARMEALAPFRGLGVGA
jgi:hypothetical protein